MKQTFDYFYSATFLRTLKSFVLILLLPILIFSSIIYWVFVSENVKKLVTEFEYRADNAAALIEQEFLNTYDYFYMFSKVPWVKKYMVETTVFNDEFTSYLKTEYCNELNNILKPGSLIADAAIVFPKKDTVVTLNRWYNIEDHIDNMSKLTKENFSEIFSHIDDLNANYFEKIKYVDINDNYILFRHNLEITNQPRAYALFLISKRALANDISRLSGLDSVKIRVQYGEQIAITLSNAISEYSYIHEIEKHSIFAKCGMNFKYGYNYIGVIINQLLIIVAAILFSFLLGFIVSYFMAVKSYKPFDHLLLRLGYVRSNQPSERLEYDFIEESFNSIYSENLKIKKDVKIHKETARNNILMKLLKGYFGEADPQQDVSHHESIRSVGICIENTDTIMVLIIKNIITDNTLLQDLKTVEQKTNELFNIIDQFFNHRQLVYYIVETINNELVVVLVLPEELQLEEMLSALTKDIEDMTGETAPIIPGPKHTGYIGISKSYQTAKEITYNVGETYYYPTDWEIQLITNLKQGRTEIVKKILTELHKENYGRGLSETAIKRLENIILETLARFLMEVGVDAKQYLQDASRKHYDFEQLILLSHNICELIAKENEKSLHANQLVHYVDKNYQDSSISLKVLGAKFDMSVSLVSKIFKEQAGVNFYTYLTHIRMENAKELLKAGFYDVATIASMVGYENEYSFKRAFLRYEGVRPKEFS